MKQEQTIVDDRFQNTILFPFEVAMMDLGFKPQYCWSLRVERIYSRAFIIFFLLQTTHGLFFMILWAQPITIYLQNFPGYNCQERIKPKNNSSDSIINPPSVDCAKGALAVCQTTSGQPIWNHIDHIKPYTTSEQCVSLTRSIFHSTNAV